MGAGRRSGFFGALRVKVKLVGALNQQLSAPVTVTDMDLTLLARFPQASMRLSGRGVR